MKKLFNSRFLIIIASSLVVLILLVVGAFYLFDDKDAVFVKSGYVLNPLSSTSEKYYFDENVGYRKNLSSMIEFVDVDDKTVSVLADSFIHYTDESISLLKNGAILDLDSVDGKNAVSFYNITNESIIEKKDDEYVIASANGDIKLDNFIARISDNKYIVVGDLRLRMIGNDTDVVGDYFEIVYVEEGIVNIENKDVKYQVTANGTNISVDGKVIDLGSKTIKVNDEDVMSITAITINGDENIEIIPKGNEEKEDEENNEDNDITDNNDQNQNDNSSGEGQGNENGGEDGEIGEEGTKVEVNDVVVSLTNVETTSVDISVTFDITNSSDEDRFVLQVLDLAAGTTVVNNDMNEFPIESGGTRRVYGLSPANKYLFMVINKKDEHKYFQKVIETNGFGIKVEKEYITKDSIGYKVILEDNSKITDATITIEEFNENEGVYKLLEDKTQKLSELQDGKISFLGLKSDTIYTVLIDDFELSEPITTVSDKYKMSLTALTLKERPGFETAELEIVSDDISKYTLTLKGIDDPYNSIVGYTYKIMQLNDETGVCDIPIPIPSGSMDVNSPFEVTVGNDPGEIKSGVNGERYCAKVVVEYFDNDKYLDYVVDGGYLPVMGAKPYVSIETNEVSYNSINATIKLIDNNCLVYGPDREGKCNGESSTIVTVRKINEATGEPYEGEVYNQKREFRKDTNGDLYISLPLTGLDEDSLYKIYVYSCIGSATCSSPLPIEYTKNEESEIRTQSFMPIKVDWDFASFESNKESVIRIPINFKELETTKENVMELDDTIDLIKRVRFSLYEGNIKDMVAFSYLEPEITALTLPIDEIKNNLLNSSYYIDTNETWGATLVYLELNSKNGETLSEEYTILVEAFMDDDCTMRFDKLSSNFMSFEVSPQLIGGEVMTTLIKKPIYYGTIKSDDNFDKNIFGDFSSSTSNPVVGYKLNGSFSTDSIKELGYTPSEVSVYVYDKNAKKNVNFYVKNNDGGLDVVNGVTGYKVPLSDGVGFFENVEIYMTRGTDYIEGQFDEIMSRGNSYYIGYEIKATAPGKEPIIIDTPLTADGDSDDLKDESGEPYVKSPKGKGVYKSVAEPKAMPTIKMYASSSTANSITYKYTINDPDKAVYSEVQKGPSFYYSINSAEEKSIPMTVVDEYNFAGDFVINNLEKGNVYSYYYKRNTNKTGVLVNDIVNAIEKNPENRIFDGYYDFSSEDDINRYNFRYERIQNDDRLILKILANDGNNRNNVILDRILSYKIDLIPENGESKSFKLGDDALKSLSVCPGDDENAVPSCLIIDYINIKEMMSSSTSNLNKIKIKLSVVYDNGLTGFDFTVGADKEYKYMIMQGNSSSTTYGTYVGYNVRAQKLESAKNLSSPSYYNYTWRKPNKDGSVSWSYKMFTDENTMVNSSLFTATLTAFGYKTGDYVLNPKMASDADMTCKHAGSVLCDEFSFLSFPPKVSVKNVSSLLDGTVYNLTLSNAEVQGIWPEGANGKEHFVYVYVWDRSVSKYVDSTGKPINFVKYVPVSIDILDRNGNLNPNGVPLKVTIDGLYEDTEYAFGVFVKLKKEKDGKEVSELTQLADVSKNNNEKLIYEFESAKTSNFFNQVRLDKVEEKVYGVRNIKPTVIMAKGDKDNVVEFDFDIIYLFCDSRNVVDCSPDSGSDTVIYQSPIIDKEFLLNDEAFRKNYVLDNKLDITNSDLEYDRNYYLYVYARVKGDVVGKDYRYVILNLDDLGRKSSVTLSALVEPSFEVVRDAIFEEVDGQVQYGLSFEISPIDKDKVLVDGLFKLQLLDENDKVVGKLNGVENYKDITFDATIKHEGITFTGLNADTKYKLVVYNDIFMNNATNTGNKVYEYRKESYAYTANNYGLALGEKVAGINPTKFFMNFLYGARYNEAIKRVDFTIQQDGATEYIANGSYIIPDDRKFVEELDINTKVNRWKLDIDLNRKLSDVAGSPDLGIYNYHIEFVLRNDDLEQNKIVFDDKVSLEKSK